MKICYNNKMEINQSLQQYLLHQPNVSKGSMQLIRTYSTYGLSNFDPKLHNENEIINKMKKGNIPDFNYLMEVKKHIGENSEFWKRLWKVYKVQIEKKSKL